MLHTTVYTSRHPLFYHPILFTVWLPGGCGTEAGLNLRSHVAKRCDQLGLGIEKSMFSAVYSGGNAKLASGAQAEHQDKGDVLRIRSGQ